MTTVERSIWINASIEEIEQVTMDSWRLPEWYSGIVEVRVDDTFPQPGSRMDFTYKAAGTTFDASQTVVEAVEGEFIQYEMEGMLTGFSRWTTVPEGDGTRMTAHFEYELPGSVLGKIADRLLLERMNAEQLEQSLAQLKALVEGG